MAVTRLALIACLAVAVASSVGLAVLSTVYLEGLSPLVTFMEAPVMLKLAMLWSALAAFCGGALILVSLFFRPGAGQNPSSLEILLWLAAAAACSIAALGAAYGEMNTQLAIAAVGPVSFGVTAPGRAEALLCLALGFWPATACLLAQTRLAARRRAAD